MTKWTAQELLDSLNIETNLEELKELYKALLAYNLGATIIDNKALDKVMEYYFDNDNITNFVNPELIDYANEILE